ncbi:MAG: hypothetical protein WB441_17630 [Nocardioidaceae bacterium]
MTVAVPAEDPASSPEARLVDALDRWQQAGATWTVLSRTASTATVALLRCDGGEEVDRLTTSDPAALAYLAERDPLRDGAGRAEEG